MSSSHGASHDCDSAGRMRAAGDAAAVPIQLHGEEAVRVTIRFGSTLHHITRQARLSVQLPGGSTVHEVIELASRLHPELAVTLQSVLPIVGGTQADQSRPLHDGDEIALVMPVAGG